MNTLKGKMLEVHMDLPPFIGKEEYAYDSDKFENGNFEVLRIEKTKSGKLYPVVRAICAGDSEEGVSLVSPISSQQITCITPDLNYGVHTSAEMMDYVRERIREGTYRYSDSELFYGFFDSIEEVDFEIGYISPCPFAGGKK